jgi:MraZ protein
VSLFLSKYTNLVDKKGRVSIPACYRSILSDTSGPLNLVISPSIKSQCLEVLSMQRLEAMNQIIQKLDPYCAERDAFETIIMGEAIQLCCDSEGRVILPKTLLEYAQITSSLVFVGKGNIFEIWNPNKFEHHLQESRIIAKRNLSILKNLSFSS